jgi:hypothetical protein
MEGNTVAMADMKPVANESPRQLTALPRVAPKSSGLNHHFLPSIAT